MQRNIILPVFILTFVYAKEDTRITGGMEAAPNSIKYQAGLIVYTADPKTRSFCGGSLISKKHIMTAAHCCDSATLIQVILGAHKIKEIEPTQLKINATKFIVHEEWNRDLIVNDIAIIVLPEEIEYNDYIEPVTLPNKMDIGKTFAGEKARVSGWGLQSDFSNSISPVLQYVYVEVITNTLCSIPFLGSITDTHICTSGLWGKSSCSGDSGGPLVIDDEQIGIVSFGLRFCKLSAPSVYTRVTNYLNWIEEKTGISISEC